jgi:hypothetical protein
MLTKMKSLHRSVLTRTMRMMKRTMKNNKNKKYLRRKGVVNRIATTSAL